VIHLKKKSSDSNQQCLFNHADSKPTTSKFIAAYRVMLVRDQALPFEAGALSNSREAQSICVFRANPATDSDGKRPLIPIESGHRFRGKPATP
jgi:hypothetical protein